VELKQFINILKKNIFFIVFFGVLGVVVALFFALKFSSGYQQSQLFYVNSPEESTQSVYNFEGYFAQEKARNFTDTAVAILTSPDFLKDVSNQSAAVGIRKLAPQVIRITVTASDPQVPAESINKIAAAFNQKLSGLTQENKAVTIKPIAKIQEPVFAGPDKKVLIAFGLMAGVVFAILTIGLKIYFKV